MNRTKRGKRAGNYEEGTRGDRKARKGTSARRTWRTRRLDAADTPSPGREDGNDDTLLSKVP